MKLRIENDPLYIPSFQPDGSIIGQADGDLRKDGVKVCTSISGLHTAILLHENKREQSKVIVAYIPSEIYRNGPIYLLNPARNSAHWRDETKYLIPMPYKVRKQLPTISFLLYNDIPDIPSTITSIPSKEKPSKSQPTKLHIFTNSEGKLPLFGITSRTPHKNDPVRVEAGNFHALRTGFDMVADDDQTIHFRIGDFPPLLSVRFTLNRSPEVIIAINPLALEAIRNLAVAA